LKYNKSIAPNVIESSPMQPSDEIEITLKAFLTALQQLDESLPPNLQMQLNEVGKQLETNQYESAAQNLESIAQKHPPLDSVYLAEGNALQKDANERNKGKTDPMPPLPEESRTEPINLAIAIFQATDSVAAAKSLPKQGPLQRVFSLFKKPESGN
jgi:hypothetical protein